MKLSCREIVTAADTVSAAYQTAARRGVRLHAGYLHAATCCAERSKDMAIHFVKSGWVPPGTATRTYGTGCVRIVTLLTSLHIAASEVVCNQSESDPRFCHSAGFAAMRELVAAVLETTEQGGIIHPDSGFSLHGTVRRLTIEAPILAAPIKSPTLPPRQPKVILTLANR